MIILAEQEPSDEQVRLLKKAVKEGKLFKGAKDRGERIIIKNYDGRASFTIVLLTGGSVFLETTRTLKEIMSVVERFNEPKSERPEKDGPCWGSGHNETSVNNPKKFGPGWGSYA